MWIYPYECIVYIVYRTHGRPQWVNLHCWHLPASKSSRSCFPNSKETKLLPSLWLQNQMVEEFCKKITIRSPKDKTWANWCFGNCNLYKNLPACSLIFDRLSSVSVRIKCSANVNVIPSPPSPEAIGLSLANSGAKSNKLPATLSTLFNHPR